ncbi:MAG: ribosome-associated translation inhibitor RaiA [Rubellimicrobium sp.]|nr:ribosome-associated translation inhibitor RaiA [Rubellimicrobium sp.]
MRYQISGKQIDIGDALTSHVKSAIDEMTGKYAGRPTDATVIFSRSAYEFVCEITVHLSSGLTAQARGVASEIYAACDAGVEKMDKQLRRYKRRLKDHYKPRSQPVEVQAASQYIVAATEESDEEADVPLSPTIIAEMETQIVTLSVGDAVMQMELANAPVLMFRNEKNGAINVVYHREDGNIGWIDPQDRH